MTELDSLIGQMERVVAERDEARALAAAGQGASEDAAAANDLAAALRVRHVATGPPPMLHCLTQFQPAPRRLPSSTNSERACISYVQLSGGMAACLSALASEPQLPPGEWTQFSEGGVSSAAGGGGAGQGGGGGGAPRCRGGGLRRGGRPRGSPPPGARAGPRLGGRRRERAAHRQPRHAAGRRPGRQVGPLPPAAACWLPCSLPSPEPPARREHQLHLGPALPILGTSCR